MKLRIQGLFALLLVLLLAAGCGGQKIGGGSGGPDPSGANAGINAAANDGGNTDGDTAGGGANAGGGTLDGGASEGGPSGGADANAGQNGTNTGGAAAGGGVGAGAGEQPGEAPGTDGAADADAAADAVLRERLASMTLADKLGAMIIAGMDGKTPDSRTKRMIAEQHVGGVIFYAPNVADAKGLIAYTNRLKAWNAGNASPLLVTVDEEGGRVSRLPGLAKFPAAAAVGATGDPDYAGRIGHYLGKASALMGFNVDYAPVLDINSNPDNPVIGDRSFGAKPAIVTKIGLPVMAGIRKEGVIPVVKHFPGHGDTSVDSHLELPVVNKTLKELQAFEWLPFRAAIEDGADAVMIAHILFPKIDKAYPASLSETIISGQLRGTLGFRGVVMTDDLTMGAIADHYGIGEAAVRSVKAGSDILLVAHGYDNVDTVLAALQKEIEAGGIAEARIDESVARILRLKIKYKLTDEPAAAAPELAGLNAQIREAVSAH